MKPSPRLIAGAVAAAAIGVIAIKRRGTDLEVVDHVDLNRYLGTWYEIARMPTRFERGCVATTATYSLNPDDTIRVVNRCRKGGLDGPTEEVIGQAWVTDTKTNARLKVRFFWPFTGDYWIIELGNGYDYAVVGHPSRKYGWILSRSPTMNEPLYQELVDRLEQEHGYDTRRLKRTLHPG